MFPESVRNFSSGVFSLTFKGVKAAYSLGRSGLWIGASSATILALPVMFETERAQMEEQQLTQQKQVLYIIVCVIFHLYFYVCKFYGVKV